MTLLPRSQTTFPNTFERGPAFGILRHQGGREESQPVLWSHQPSSRVARPFELTAISLSDRTEPVHSGWVSWRKRRRRLGFTTHHEAHAFLREFNVGDVTSSCRCRPSMALKYVQNLFTLQSVRCLHMSNRAHRVRSSAKSFSEPGGRNIADPVRDSGLMRDFACECVNGCRRKIHKQAFCDDQRRLRTRRFIYFASLLGVDDVSDKPLTTAIHLFA